MNWAARRAALLGQPQALSVDDVFDVLLDRDAVLYMDAGELRYVGPDLGDSDPLQAAVDAHRAELTDMFTYAPGGRCVFTGCYRLPAEGDLLACAEHRTRMEQDA